MVSKSHRRKPRDKSSVGYLKLKTITQQFNGFVKTAQSCIDEEKLFLYNHVRKKDIAMEHLNENTSWDLSHLNDNGDLASLLKKKYGEVGTSTRDAFERGFRNSQLGEFLQDFRKSKKITQVELSKRTGIDRSYISMIENSASSVTVETLQKYIGGLGASLVISIENDGEQISCKAI